MTAAESLILTPDEPGLSPFERLLGIIETWHDLTHPGAFCNCDDQPCQAAYRLGRSVVYIDEGEEW